MAYSYESDFRGEFSRELVLRAGSQDYEISDELFEVRLHKIFIDPVKFRGGIIDKTQEGAYSDKGIGQAEMVAGWDKDGLINYQVRAEGHKLDKKVISFKPGAYSHPFELVLDMAEKYAVPVSNVQFGEDVLFKC